MNVDCGHLSSSIEGELNLSPRMADLAETFEPRIVGVRKENVQIFDLFVFGKQIA